MNATPINPWHCLTANAALKHAESRLDDGLSDDSARRRPAEFGKNQLVAEPTRTAFKILLAQWAKLLGGVAADDRMLVQ